MYNVRRFVDVHLGQNYEEGASLPEMKSFEDMKKLYVLEDPLDPCSGFESLDSFHSRYDF